MTTLAYTVPVAGTTLNSIADPEVATALTTILTWANGNIDATNFSPTATLASALAAPKVAMTSQTRVMETAYQPNTTRPTFVLMTFHLVTTAIANNVCQAVVLMDSANPPTTTIADASVSQSGGGSATTLDVPVSFIVPAAFYYKPHVGAAGSSCTITSTFEYTL